MAVVLGATGVFIYLRYSSELKVIDQRDEALTDLLQQLVVAGPVALLLASLAGYGVAAAALRPMLARLGEALEHERSFVADASHELRTPLAILRTELELALAEGRSADELRAAVASAAEETDRLIQLSEDLLTIAQTERGELPLRISPTALEETFATVGGRFSRRASAAGRAIEVDAAGVELGADRLRLDQAIGNMVDNSLRYGAGTIVLSAVAREGEVEIHVSDRGPGFPPEFLDRAFERFSRRSPSRGDGGSGLGLAIVRTVARAHGGEAGAENLEEGGADVWMTIPLSSGSKKL
jgi:two-component system OmpR family sensor kinase